MKINKKCVKAMHRKIKIFCTRVQFGKMSYKDVYQSYQSWRAHAKRCDSYRTVKGMDKYFERMFSNEIYYT